MNNSDKKQFLALVDDALAATNRKPLTAGGMQIWWKILQAFPWALVEQSIVSVLSRDEYLTPGAVRGAIPGAQWPTADETWARIPKSESDAVVDTTEALMALAAAAPMIDDGDMIGARMAFKGAYDAAVLASKNAGRFPRYQISQGWDKSTTEPAVEKALALGQISKEVALAYLPQAAADRLALSGERKMKLMKLESK